VREIWDLYLVVEVSGSRGERDLRGLPLYYSRFGRALSLDLGGVPLLPMFDLGGL